MHIAHQMTRLLESILRQRGKGSGQETDEEDEERKGRSRTCTICSLVHIKRGVMCHSFITKGPINCIAEVH